MLKLILHVKNETAENISEQLLKKIVLKSLKKRNVTNQVIIDIFIAKSETIRKLNLKYRNFNQPTTVLSFPTTIAQVKEKVPYKTSQNIPVLLGDVIICPEVVRKETPDKQFVSAINILIDHSIAHLLGYHHK